MNLLLTLDEVFDSELKNYLLSQTGITKVDIIAKDFLSTLSITYEEKTNPFIIIK